jgi:hypothetical protein
MIPKLKWALSNKSYYFRSQKNKGVLKNDEVYFILFGRKPISVPAALQLEQLCGTEKKEQIKLLNEENS